MRSYEELEELDDHTPAPYDISKLNLHIPSNWRSICDR